MRKRDLPGKARMLRVSPNLNDRIHEYQKKLREKTGVEVSWSVAVRALIEKGLEASR